METELDPEKEDVTDIGINTGNSSQENMTVYVFLVILMMLIKNRVNKRIILFGKN